MAHRDMKPSNVLLDAKLNIKVTDFGLGSFFAEAKKLNTPCGSPCFAAPEVLSGSPYLPKPYDMWGLGVILFNLLAGRLPFDEPTKQDLYSKIRSVTYDMPEDLPNGAKKLIRQLLVRDPTKRMKMEEFWKDPWIQEHGSKAFTRHLKPADFKPSKIELP